MAEERKDSFAETVDTAASAAHTVKGAIKAGKAISGAAKGAAAGGPYGAVAGAVWAGRKHIGKIIAVIVILLLLPVLFVLMLPGLIFGGLINAFSPADTEQPVLNSETAIVENANDITFTINSILGEALDDVMARIEADFAASGADQMEVKNPYSSGPVYNANLIISQYCAAGMKTLRAFPWMTWPLSCGRTRSIFTPIPVCGRAVRSHRKTRRPGKKLQPPRSGWSTPSVTTASPILPTMFSRLRMSRKSLPPIMPQT